MEAFIKDLRYGFRSLAKTPTLTLVAILSLAIGVGSNVAIFSFVDALWLRPLPVGDSASLVSVFTSDSEANREVARGESSYPDYLDISSQSKSFRSLAALERRGALLDIGTETLQVTASVVSENFFSTMQVSPRFGRAFVERDSASGLRAVLLSHGFWTRQFNADAALVGHTIVLDNQEVVVLGILPPGFHTSGTTTPPDIWVPMSTWNALVQDDQRLTRRARRTFEIYGRLQPGVNLRTASAELQTIAGRLEQDFPQSNAGRKMSVEFESATAGTWGRQVSVMLLGIGLLVLLIACANVSSLLVARAERRQKEIATRIALGGTRTQLARQLLAEGLLLTAFGLVAALLAASWLVPALRSMLPLSAWASGVEAQVDLRALIFACVAGGTSMLFAGVIPALSSTNLNVIDALKQTGNQPRLRGTWLRNAIVIGQVALSLVIMASASLLVRTVLKMQAIEPGFESNGNLVIMEVIPSFTSRSSAELRAYATDARRAMAEVAGTQRTAAALRIPLGDSGGGRKIAVFTERELADINSPGRSILMTMVSDGYFETIGTRLLRGRGFAEQDISQERPVIVINRSLAEMLWPNEDAVGKHVRLGKRDAQQFEILGVAEDGRYNRLTENPGPYLYMPLTSEFGEFDLIASTSPDASTMLPVLREHVRALDRTVPVINATTIREHLRNSVEEQRTSARLVSALGLLGLMLAAIGLYGLMSFVVGSRLHEIGIRMAVGASQSRIFVLVIGRALRLAAIGIIVGIGGSVVAVRVLRGLLYGISVFDGLSFSVAILLLLLAALFAALLPALRATRVDIINVLRYD